MPHNTRFPEIWAILTKHIDFEGKTLLDVGCGYGDLIKAAHGGGAKVWGIDKDFDLVHNLRGYADKDFEIKQDDINDWGRYYFSFEKQSFDIITCFSVLPYLDDPETNLHQFRPRSDITIIECQYNGDGPGLEWLKGDSDMEVWLKIVWSDVKKIGETEVKGRGFRSIWLCE